MEMSLFSDEQILKAYTKDIQKNIKREVRRNWALKLLSQYPLSIEEIAELTQLPIEEVRDIKNNFNFLF